MRVIEGDIRSRADLDQAVAGGIDAVVHFAGLKAVGAHPSGRIGEDPSGIPNNLFPIVSQVVLPFLAVLSDPERLWQQPLVQELAGRVGFTEAVVSP